MTPQGQFVSSNWSGYVLPSFKTGDTYTSIQATWIIPNVFGGKKGTVSTNWIGIGGFCEDAECEKVDTTLIRLGTTQRVINGFLSVYFAWYETLPDVAFGTSLAVHPYDVVTSSLSCNPCTGAQSWTLSMINETTGDIWNTNVPYQASQLSTEWIVGAPAGHHAISPLANYHTSTFDSLAINRFNAELLISDSIIMEDPHHQTSNVSFFNDSGHGFTACYGGHDTLVQCPFIPLP